MSQKPNQNGQPQPDVDYFFVDEGTHLDVGPLDQYVGCLSFEFNMVESLLLGLFGRVLGMDGFSAQAVSTILLWNKKLELLNSAITRRSELQPVTPYWKRLHAFLTEIGSERNFIIHGERLQRVTDGLPDEHAITSHNFGDVWKFARRSNEEIDEFEIKELILDMRAANNAINRLDWYLLGLEEPSLETLLQSAIRRRPPRHVRKIGSSAQN